MGFFKLQSVLLCSTSVAAAAAAWLIVKWRKKAKKMKTFVEIVSTKPDFDQKQEDPVDATDGTIVKDKISGVINVKLPNRQEFPAYSRTDHDGSSWIVVQKRHCGKVDFERGWKDYENGFGNFEEAGEFWLGLNKLSLILREQPRNVRFVIGSGENQFEAKYDAFQISDAEDKYRIRSLGNYNGGLGDYLKVGAMFHTLDSKHAESENSAVASGGGWWFSESCFVNLNSFYQPGLETRMEISY